MLDWAASSEGFASDGPPYKISRPERSSKSKSWSSKDLTTASRNRPHDFHGSRCEAFTAASVSTQSATSADFGCMLEFGHMERRVSASLSRRTLPSRGSRMGAAASEASVLPDRPSFDVPQRRAAWKLVHPAPAMGRNASSVGGRPPFASVRYLTWAVPQETRSETARLSMP